MDTDKSFKLYIKKLVHSSWAIVCQNDITAYSKSTTIKSTMSDNFAPTHHTVTSDVSGGRNTGDYSSGIQGSDISNTANRGYDNSGYGATDTSRATNPITDERSFGGSNLNDSGRPEFTGTYGGRNDDSITPVDASASHDRLNSEYEPRTQLDQQRGSLASTQGPFQTPTTDDVDRSDAPLTSSVGSQNAPGTGGKIGEATMGALGYGGANVERPKEEQGVAEKIMNFMGA